MNRIPLLQTIRAIAEEVKKPLSDDLTPEQEEWLEKLVEDAMDREREIGELNPQLHQLEIEETLVAWLREEVPSRLLEVKAGE